MSDADERRNHMARIESEIAQCDAALREHNLSVARDYPKLSKADIEIRMAPAREIVRRRSSLRAALSKMKRSRVS
jgi:hypothetical protein